jgi:hypothetical protein
MDAPLRYEADCTRHVEWVARSLAPRAQSRRARRVRLEARGVPPRIALAGWIALLRRGATGPAAPPVSR